MRIATVEVIPYALPFREPYVTARGTLERREMALLRIRAEDGTEGLGEATPLTLRGGATLDDVVRSLAEAAGTLEGEDLEAHMGMGDPTALERFNIDQHIVRYEAMLSELLNSKVPELTMLQEGVPVEAPCLTSQ